MESFFKNRTVIAKSCDGRESESGHIASCALPPLASQQDTQSEADEETTNTTEAILDAEAEGYKVEMIKEHDVVTKIRITCSCGQQFTLNCQYPPPEEDASQ